uniref:Uncharacterized protein n=1 Tax=Arundo donax TaxID=35708 RepID=A0A0A9QLL9_ARUDO
MAWQYRKTIYSSTIGPHQVHSNCSFTHRKMEKHFRVLANSLPVHSVHTHFSFSSSLPNSKYLNTWEKFSKHLKSVEEKLKIQELKFLY